MYQIYIKVFISYNEEREREKEERTFVNISGIMFF